MEAGAAQTCLPIALTPWCLFGFFLGIQKEPRPALRPQARFGAQPPHSGRLLARRWRNPVKWGGGGMAQASFSCPCGAIHLQPPPYGVLLTMPVP